VTNRFDRKVLKIEANSGNVTASIQLTEAPTTAVSQDGAVWVAAFKKIFRLNSQNGQVEATIELGSFDPVSLRVSETGVWAGVMDISKHHLIPLRTDYCPTGGLVHIDPKTNKQVKFIDLKVPAFYLAASGSEVWVDQMGCLGDPHKLVKINPVNYSISPYPDLSAAMDPDGNGFEVFLGSLWAAGKAGETGTVIQLDPLTGKSDRKITLPGTMGAAGIGLTSSADSLWAYDKITAKIYRVPPTGSEAELFFQPDAKSGILDQVIAMRQNLWLIWTDQARMLQADVRSKQIVREVGTGMNKITYFAGISWQPCPAAYPSRLRVGDLATVSKDPPLPNRLRAEPNTSSTILGQVEAGGEVGIVDGPVCSNNWIWWKVRTTKAGQGGWTSEGDENNYWLVPERP
jgi:streptogramin lyase